jgi:BirA family biotin operon repressor/biotin-[acetyl-CoA-carboxylase] ligase
VDRQFLLNKAISLGVLDFVQSMLPAGTCKIKWPNDICYGSSKIGGILINHTISGNTFDASVIGIGINVNQTHFDPSVPNPVSVKQIIFKDTDLDHALNLLIKNLDVRYDQLKQGDFYMLDLDYRSKLSGLNEIKNYRTDSGIFQGIIRDVDPFGRLIIEDADKNQMTFSHGEVEFLK